MSERRAIEAAICREKRGRSERVVGRHQTKGEQREAFMRRAVNKDNVSEKTP
jgi:hypothetical protein